MLLSELQRCWRFKCSSQSEVRDTVKRKVEYNINSRSKLLASSSELSVTQFTGATPTDHFTDTHRHTHTQRLCGAADLPSSVALLLVFQLEVISETVTLKCVFCLQIHTQLHVCVSSQQFLS